ncbi:MAG: hypothetical protein LBC70_03310 [Chitinispirillales bacterium]|jgi:hypothetical protein|nr:hypothetical protein [Chitinispirillales bacterium]
MPCELKVRDVGELSANPRRSLTRDQLDHIEEYLTLKNHAKSAKDVSIAGGVDHVIDNLDYYLGVPEANAANVIY